eukprot:scaffold141346_cov298-Phaeocystis_antarctica.AAC.1
MLLTAPTHEGQLQSSLRWGIIKQSEHDLQLRRLRAESGGGGGGTLSALPTRTHGTTRRLNLKDQWYAVTGAFPNKAAAMRAVKTRQVVHGNNGGDWKCNAHANGGGCKAYYHCNGHKECPVQLRARKLPPASVGTPSEGWYIE